MRLAAALGPLAALALFGCATLPPCPAKGGPAWTELTSSHFVVRTDLERADAESLVRELEETRAALLAMAWPTAPDPTGQTAIIAFRSGGELHEFAPPSVVGWTIKRRPFPTTVVLGGMPNEEALNVVAHELAHQLSQRFLPLQPLWYSEGIATFFETLTYDRDSHRARAGRPAQPRLRALRMTGLMPADTLADVEDELTDADRFYGTSLMLFHYLIDKRPADFSKFQGRIGRLTPWRIAWKESFPDLSADKLDAELSDYWNGSLFNGTQRELTIVVGKIDVRPLSDAEVHALRAYLYAIGGPPKTARTNEEIAETQAQDRGNVEASAVAFYRTGVPEAEGKALAGEARTRHPSDWLAATMAADAGGDVARIRSILLVALARAPQQPELLVRLALAEAITGRWEQALSFSTTALRLGAVDNQLLVVHTEALARTGKCADASFFIDALARRFGPKQAARLDSARAAREHCVEAPPPSTAEPAQDAPP